MPPGVHSFNFAGRGKLVIAERDRRGHMDTGGSVPSLGPPSPSRTGSLSRGQYRHSFVSQAHSGHGSGTHDHGLRFSYAQAGVEGARQGIHVPRRTSQGGATQGVRRSNRAVPQQPTRTGLGAVVKRAAVHHGSSAVGSLSQSRPVLPVLPVALLELGATESRRVSGGRASAYRGKRAHSNARAYRSRTLRARQTSRRVTALARVLSGTQLHAGLHAGSPRPDWMVPPHFKWNPHTPSAQAIYEGLPAWQRQEPEWMKIGHAGGYLMSSRAYLVKPTTPYAYSMRDNNSLKDGSDQEPLSPTPPSWDIGPTQSVHGGARLFPWTPTACAEGNGMCALRSGHPYGFFL